MEVGNVLKVVFTTWTFFSCAGKDAKDELVKSADNVRATGVIQKTKAVQTFEMETVFKDSEPATYLFINN